MSRITSDGREYTIYYNDEEPEEMTTLIENSRMKSFPIADYTDSLERGYIERKTWIDAWVSIIDGRMFDERWDMATCGKPVSWLVEGNRELAKKSFHEDQWKKLLGMIRTIQVVWNQPVMYSDNMVESAEAIEYFFNIVDSIPSPPLVRNKYKVNQLEQVAVLAGIKNIGPQVARLVLMTYKSIRNLIHALEKDGIESLTRIKGIKEKKAGMIMDGLFKEIDVSLLEEIIA